MRRTLLLLSIGLFAMPTAFATKRKAIVIGLDGTRGDIFHKMVLSQQKTPTFLKITQKGSSITCSKITDPGCAQAYSTPLRNDSFQWKTGPGWASVLTGVEGEKHLVGSNSHSSLSKFAKSSQKFPSFLKQLKDKGYRTAGGGVSTFLSSFDDEMVSVGVLDYECGTGWDSSTVGVAEKESCNLDYRNALSNNDYNRDRNLASWAVKIIQEDRADVIMTVFDQIDAVGHDSGFDDNRDYRESIIKADKQVQTIISAIEKRVEKHGESWLVLLTSDHGGHTIKIFKTWGSHSDNSPEDSAIPFALAIFGSSEKLKVQDLSQLKDVKQMDIHPTILDWFSEPKAKNLDGISRLVKSP